MNFIDLINIDKFKNSSPLSFIVGEDDNGELVLEDLKKAQHIFVGGRAASGKTNFLHTLISSLLLKNKATDLKVIAVEGKDIDEYEFFEKFKHVKVVNNFEGFIYVLNYLDNEMQLRASMMMEKGYVNIDDYNRCDNVISGKVEKIPYIVVLLDDALKFILDDNRVGRQLTLLIKRARAYGIHFVISCQGADMLPFDMVDALPSRVCFKVSNDRMSRDIINDNGAEDLSNFGECLCRFVDAYQLRKVKCPLVDLSSIEDIIKV